MCVQARVCAVRDTSVPAQGQGHACWHLTSLVRFEKQGRDSHSVVPAGAPAGGASGVPEPSPGVRRR